MVDEIVASPQPAASASEPPALSEVPSSLARRILLFEFVVLIEYWLAPLLFGLTNYAGIWSDAGVVLFFVFVASIVFLVLLPLRRHLARANRTPRGRSLFHAVWIGAFSIGLFVTNTFQIGVGGAAPGAVQFSSTTVYTPFGAWPALTVFIPKLGLFGTLDVEIVAVLFLVSFLGSCALRLNALRVARACPTPETKSPTWRKEVARLAVWSPLGFMSGCAACAPLYLSAAGLVVPAVATTGFAVEPLVPWIGLAGLLYLVSFGLALHFIRDATGPRLPARSNLVE